ncbi:SRPBCC family protein [Cryptosporangium japonicum]
MRTARAMSTLLAIVGALTVAAAPASATPDTGSGPGAPQCAGRGTDPAARIRYRAETVIDAPLRTVWRIQTDVARWPTWQSAVTTSKRLDRGPLRPGSSFRWTTPVPETALNPATTLAVTSTVKQVQRQKCVRWTGPAVGKGLRIDQGVHVWEFREVHGRVHVRTEETWRGAQPEQDVAFSTAVLGAGLDAWLKDLKTTAERECGRH